MTTRIPLIVGMFDDVTSARRAYDLLNQAGFAQEQLGMAIRSKDGATTNLQLDLVALGLSEERALYYEQQYEAGRILVSVRPDGREQEARDILVRSGALDEHMITRSPMGTTSTTGAAFTTSSVADDQERSLKLREEQLQATKERVQSGEVILHKEVVTEQKTINVPVTHEEVFIERRAVSGAQVDNTPLSEGETIRVPVSEEHVEITKTPIVTGEVSIGKRTVQETKRVSGTVKREEARIEQEGNAPIHGTKSDYLHPDQQNDTRI